MHAEINIKGGNILQNEIFLLLEDKYDLAIQEHPVPLENGEGNHNVDIFLVNESSKTIFAYNSKGASFNSTRRPEGELDEYKMYKRSIQAAYPEYTVYYIILKDKYKPACSKHSRYRKFDEEGTIQVINTEEFLTHAGLSYQEADQRRREKILSNLSSDLTLRKIVSDLDTLISVLYPNEAFS